jgi:hypothetical protein
LARRINFYFYIEFGKQHANYNNRKRGAMHTSQDLQSKISQSKLDEGLSLEELSIGDLVEVKTSHRCYTLENRGDGEVLISGHPRYCPYPVLVKLIGSIWGGPVIKVGFIGRGMSMEFQHPVFGIVHTSRIESMRRLEHKSQMSDWQLVSRN